MRALEMSELIERIREREKIERENEHFDKAKVLRKQRRELARKLRVFLYGG